MSLGGNGAFEIWVINDKVGVAADLHGAFARACSMVSVGVDSSENRIGRAARSASPAGSPSKSGSSRRSPPERRRGSGARRRLASHAPSTLSPVCSRWSRNVSGRSAASVASHNDRRASWTAASRVSPEKVRKIRVFSAAPTTSYISLDYRAQEGFIYRIARAGEAES